MNGQNRTRKKVLFKIIGEKTGRFERYHSRPEMLMELLALIEPEFSTTFGWHL